MGYCTKAELIQALANALSQGSPSQPGVLVDVFSVGQMVSDTVNDTQIFQYIKWADENIDAGLGSIYQTPFKRVNRGSFEIGIDITAGDTSIVMPDATRFTQDDIVLVRDSATGLKQQVTIASVPSDTQIALSSPMTSSYPALTTKVERIRYPDPIPKMSARLAAATLYDKHFASQAEANKSEYGAYLRKMVADDMNRIVTGVSPLDIPDAHFYVGRRYYNASLDDVMNTRAKPEGKFFEE